MRSRHKSGYRPSARYAYDHGFKVGDETVYGSPPRRHVLLLRRSPGGRGMSPYWRAV